MESGTSFGYAEGSGIGQLSAGTKNPAQHARMNSLRGPTAHSMPTAQPKDLKEDPMDKALPPLPRNPEKTVSFLGRRPITGIDPAGGQALRAVSSPREPTSTGENDLQDFNGQKFSGKPCQRSERTLFRPLSAISANGRPIQNSPVRVHYQPETYQPPQKGLGQLEIGKTLGKEQTRPSIREKKETLVPRALVSDEDSEKVSKGATCKLLTEYPLEFSTQRAVETCGLQTIATTSPFKSSLIYQDPSVAPELLNVDQMVQYPIHNLFEDHLIMTERRPMQASRPFVDQLMILERMGIHEDLICLQNQEEAEDLAAKTAPTHITTTTGFDQADQGTGTKGHPSGTGGTKYCDPEDGREILCEKFGRQRSSEGARGDFCHTTHVHVYITPNRTGGSHSAETKQGRGFGGGAGRSGQFWQQDGGNSEKQPFKERKQQGPAAQSEEAIYRECSK
ncbi:hypothetical protein EsH8_IX_000524 [Colletotrichum jinshuiense]